MFSFSPFFFFSFYLLRRRKQGKCEYIYIYGVYTMLSNASRCVGSISSCRTTFPKQVMSCHCLKSKSIQWWEISLLYCTKESSCFLSAAKNPVMVIAPFEYIYCICIWLLTAFIGWDERISNCLFLYINYNPMDSENMNTYIDWYVCKCKACKLLSHQDIHT